MKEIRQGDFKRDKYGHTQNNRGLREEGRARTQRGSSKVGLSMKIRLEAADPDDFSGKWKLVHLQGSLYHNYPPSQDPSIHPGHSRHDMLRMTSSSLSTAVLVASQTAVGISPEIVATTLRRADPDTFITAKHISNRKDAEHREELTNNTSRNASYESNGKNVFLRG